MSTLEISLIALAAALCLLLLIRLVRSAVRRRRQRDNIIRRLSDII